MLNAAVNVKPSSTEGLGIFATRDFARGDVIRQVKIVREITNEAPLSTENGEQFEHCAYPDGKVVLYHYPDRHMNHSCEPNAYNDYSQSPPLTRALRDIHRGEELSVDYLINNSGGDSWECTCGAKRCRGKTGTSFFELPIEFQREYMPLLAPWFRAKHTQALTAILNPPDPEE